MLQPPKICHNIDVPGTVIPSDAAALNFPIFIILVPTLKPSFLLGKIVGGMHMMNMLPYLVREALTEPFWNFMHDSQVER